MIHQQQQRQQRQRQRQRHPDAPTPPAGHPTAVRGVDPDTGAAVWIEPNGEDGPEIVAPIINPDGTRPAPEPVAAANSADYDQSAQPVGSGSGSVLERSIGSDQLTALAEADPGRHGWVIGLGSTCSHNDTDDNSNSSTDDNDLPTPGTLRAYRAAKGSDSEESR